MYVYLSLPAQYGRTETVVNSQDPDFATPIQMNYRFEEVQKLRFVVYDIDNDTSSLSDDDLLGYHECTLAQVCVGKVLRGHVEQLHMRNLQVTLSSITNV